MNEKILPGIYRPAQGRRGPRTPRELKHRINKRAFQLSGEVYERYRAELEAAIAEGTTSTDAIDDWRPSENVNRLDI